MSSSEQRPPNTEEDCFVIINRALALSGYKDLCVDGLEGDDVVIVEVLDPDNKTVEEDKPVIEYPQPLWTYNATKCIIYEYGRLRTSRYSRRARWHLLCARMKRRGFVRYTVSQCRTKIRALLRTFHKSSRRDRIKWPFYQLMHNIHRKNPKFPPLSTQTSNFADEATGIVSPIIKVEKMESDVQQSNAKKARRPANIRNSLLWPGAATKTLVLEYAKLDSCMPKKQMWTKLSGTLSRLGYNLTPNNCKHKMICLLRQYWTIKSTRRKKIKWRMFAFMDKAFTTKIKEEILDETDAVVDVTPNGVVTVKDEKIKLESDDFLYQNCLENEYEEVAGELLNETVRESPVKPEYSNSDSEDGENMLLWSHRATAVLIKEFGRIKDSEFDRSSQFVLLDAHLKKNGFRNFTVQQCRNKIFCLIRTYKKLKLRQLQSNSVSAKTRKRWPYFELMDELFCCDDVATSLEKLATRNDSIKETVRRTSIDDAESVDDVGDLETPQSLAIPHSALGTPLWPMKATALLLAEYLKLDPRMSKKSMWVRLSRVLGGRGYSLTADNCRHKFLTLVRQYEMHKERKSKGMPVTWHFYKLMEQLFGKKAHHLVPGEESGNEEEDVLHNKKTEEIRKALKRKLGLMTSDTEDDFKDGAFVSCQGRPDRVRGGCGRHCEFWDLRMARRENRHRDKMNLLNDLLVVLKLYSESITKARIHQQWKAVWPPETVPVLMHNYSVIMDKRISRKKCWRILKNKLAELGYEVTISQCRNKVFSMLKTYDDLRRTMQKNASYRVQWKHYNLMYSIYKDKHTFTKNYVGDVSSPGCDDDENEEDDDEKVVDNTHDDQDVTFDATTNGDKLILVRIGSIDKISLNDLRTSECVPSLLEHYHEIVGAGLPTGDSWLKISERLHFIGFELSEQECLDKMSKLLTVYKAMSKQAHVTKWPYFGKIHEIFKDYNIDDVIRNIAACKTYEIKSEIPFEVKFSESDLLEGTCRQHCDSWHDRLAFRQIRHDAKMKLRLDLLKILKDMALKKKIFNYNRNKRWPFEVTSMLIRKFGDLCRSVDDRRAIYDSLSEYLHEVDFPASPQQTRMHILSLLNTYWKPKYRVYTEWPYRDLMDKAVGDMSDFLYKEDFENIEDILNSCVKLENTLDCTNTSL